ncbi:MAG TPA: hypothetical protein VM597_39945 [Gemmataceae bacterium]|nr:hypothetical protein [Gemmataceae bacterium]
MLFLQFQPKNDVELVGFVLGVTLAGLVSGGIPFGFGLATRQTGLGVVGGVISAVTGAALGCCGGIPVAFLFCGIIVVMAWVTRINQIGRPIREPSPADYDDYVDTEDDYRRALPRFAEPVEGDDEPRKPQDRPRWRTYDDGERRRDERRHDDW